MSEPVVLKVVADETEAEIVCGLLRSAGFECGYRDTEALDSPFENFSASGPREILVHESDLDAARELLAEAGDASRSRRGLRYSAGDGRLDAALRPGATCA